MKSVRPRDTSTPFALMKKYIKELEQEIFYSEDEEPQVKKEEPDIVKTQQSENDSMKKLRLESYGDLFAGENGDPEKTQSAGKRGINQQDDFYLPQEGSESSSCGLEVQVESCTISEQKGGPKPSRMRKTDRKIRTVITKQKLQQINQIFRDYHEKKGNGEMTLTNLKEIGRKLQLGYSTILHKYKQFKQNKHVKGGYLLEIEGSKRKYGKSVLVESHIKEALKKVELANAVEISKYIFKTKEVYYSRAVICRHLLAMKKEGNERSTVPSQSLPIIQEIVKEGPNIYVKTFEEQLEEEKQKENIVYCHEIVFSFKEFQQNSIEDDLARWNKKRGDCLSVTLVLAINQNSVIYHTIRRGFILQEDYCQVLTDLARTIDSKRKGRDGQMWVAANINQIHYNKTQYNTEQSDEILRKYRMKKIIIKQEYLGLDPLKNLFMRIKDKLKNEQKKFQPLRNAIQTELREWIEEGLSFSF